MTFPMIPKLPERGEGCPSATELEELVGKSDASNSAVSAHAQGCSACGGYVAALRMERLRFNTARPKEMLLSQLAQARQKLPRVKQRWLLSASVTAAAFAIGIVLYARAPTGDDITFKGRMVAIHVLHAGVERTLGDGDVVHPRDALRFVLHAKRAGYAAVFERDPDGRVSVVAPFGATAPAPIQPGSTTLPDSAQLDSVLGTETFFTVFATDPFDLAAITAQIKTQPKPECLRCLVDRARFEKQP